ncbi:MAG: KH domain-containing protein [bacterium]|nr:KH domain-containing protein [bacterium]
MKQLVETVCKSLVDNPEEVKVTQIDGEQTTILELRVHQSDLGKVIGKQGRTARAIRTILAAAGMKQRRRFNLEIIERFDEDHNKEGQA